MLRALSAKAEKQAFNKFGTGEKKCINFALKQSM